MLAQCSFLACKLGSVSFFLFFFFFVCVNIYNYMFVYVFLQPIERKPRKFNPLVIPKKLQADLPFDSKPKDISMRKRPLLENRRAVVMEPHERKGHALVQHLQLIKNEKVSIFNSKLYIYCTYLWLPFLGS